MCLLWIPYDAPVAETVIEERYTLERLLGKGGMGEVWAGHDRRLRRPVAVKLMRQHGEVGGNGVERFVREAQLTKPALSIPACR